MINSSIKANFTSKFIQALAVVMAKKDVREYLMGIHVQPHPEKGVVISACDGHRMLTCYDADGFCSEEFIFSPSKALQDACKRKSGVKNVMSNPSRIIVEDGLMTITSHRFEDAEEELSPKYIVSCHPLKVIEGRYPDLTRVINSALELKSDTNFCVNASYMNDIAKVSRFLGNGKFDACSVSLAGNRGMTIRFNYVPEAFMILMPMKSEVLDQQEWVSQFASSGQEQEAKEAA